MYVAVLLFCNVAGHSASRRPFIFVFPSTTVFPFLRASPRISVSHSCVGLLAGEALPPEVVSGVTSKSLDEEHASRFRRVRRRERSEWYLGDRAFNVSPSLHRGKPSQWTKDRCSYRHCYSAAHLYTGQNRATSKANA